MVKEEKNKEERGVTMVRPFKPLFILEAIREIIPFLGATFFVVILTVIFGSLIGILLANILIKGNSIKKVIAQSYIYIIRSTPSIILLFMVFYGLPEVLLKVANIN